jgi:hypothetical protein
MSLKAKARMAAAEAEQNRQAAEEHARLAAENPALADESEYVIDWGEHKGHRTHTHPWHGNGVICSCGACVGCFSIAISGDEPEPEPCSVCIARGIPLDGR